MNNDDCSVLVSLRTINSCELVIVLICTGQIFCHGENSTFDRLSSQFRIAFAIPLCIQYNDNIWELKTVYDYLFAYAMFLLSCQSCVCVMIMQHQFYSCFYVFGGNRLLFIQLQNILADCRICVWNASDGSLVHSLTGHTESVSVNFLGFGLSPFFDTIFTFFCKYNVWGMIVLLFYEQYLIHKHDIWCLVLCFSVVVWNISYGFQFYLIVL